MGDKEPTLDNIETHEHETGDFVDVHNKILNDLKTVYSNNTEKFMENYGLKNKIEILENDIKIKKRKLRELIATHGAAQTKWNQVIYDNKKFENEYKFLMIVSTLHFFILILILMGYFDFVNNFLITIGTLILYLIIIGVFVVKMDVNRNRNEFNYNEFNLKYEPTGVCNINPQDVGDKEEMEKNEKKLTELTT